MDSKLREALYLLEDYNGIFRQLWELGRIKFTKDPNMPTACIKFDREGKELGFWFNQDFYDKLTHHELCFVIIHECLHVLLYHGKRQLLNQKYQINHELFNCAADIAIHEIIYNEFGFDRSLVTQPHCTVESVFKDRANDIKRCETTEYYYNEMINKGICKSITLDIHNFMDGSGDGQELEDFIKKAFDRINNIEKRELQNKLKDINRGTTKGNEWFTVEVSPVKKKKWEVAIKDWAASHIVADRFDWTKPNRRIAGLSNDLFLPSHLEMTHVKKKAWLYMDTSGSCIDLAPRFFSAAASLPKKFFDVRLFCFDTEIYETSIRSREVKGGGGTSFDIIQKHIDDVRGNPDIVFVITDGYGNYVDAKQPKKWNIFLTTDYKECFPSNCVFHSFEEFE